MSGNTYIDEFLGIAGFLARSQKVPIDKGYILVSRKILDNMLNRNSYDTVDNKLRIWKRLHWIDAEPDRYTKQISRNGKRTRVVKIDLDVYYTMALLFQKEVGQ